MLSCHKSMSNNSLPNNNSKTTNNSMSSWIHWRSEWVWMQTQMQTPSQCKQACDLMVYK